MTSESTIARQKLSEDLRAVIADTEELLKATAGQVDEKIKSTRSKVEETLRSAKSRVENLEHATIENAKAAAKATNQYVHNNPWPAIGIAAGVGLLVGWIVGRK